MQVFAEAMKRKVGILARLPLAGGSDGAAFNPATMEAFSSHGNGTLTVNSGGAISATSASASAGLKLPKPWPE